MKASDGRLHALAKAAGVRPPHVLFVWHYRREMKAHFSAEVCAQFAQLEQKHVERIIAVLDEVPAPQPRLKAARGPLAINFVIPEDWITHAMGRRFWTRDVCQTEAMKFVDHHRAKGNTMADWFAAWRTWINAPWKENGSADPDAVRGRYDDAEAQKAYLERMNL